jgi:hypothetical protein
MLRYLQVTAVLCAVGWLCPSTVAQQHALDQGGPDSVIMVVSWPAIHLGDSSVVAQLFFVNDVQALRSAAMGFGWDYTGLVMDSAALTPLAKSAFHYYEFFYYKDNIDSTNTKRLFMFAGSGISGSLAPAPDRQHVATYWFHATRFPANDSIVIDTNTFSAGATFKFVDASPEVNQYVPAWGGRVVVEDTSDCPEPEPPVLVSPSNHATGLPQPIDLDWNPVTGADYYEVQVDDNGDFSSPELNEQTANTTYSVSGLAEGATYYWRVQAHNNCGWGEWSYPTRHFTTAEPDWHDPLDQGNPDSVIMVVSQPNIYTGDSTVTAELYFVNDAQDLLGAAAGFSWDSPYLVMDSAAVTPLAAEAFSFMRFLLYKDDMDSTNIHRLFQFVGTGLGTSLAAAPVRQHVATYWFHVTDFPVGGSIDIDTSTFNSGVNLTFVDATPQNEQYVPRWGGRAVIQLGETDPPAHPLDHGDPDSVIMVVSQPAIYMGDSTVTAELYFVNDAQDLQAAAASFSWDSPYLVMDSAAVTPLAAEAFSFMRILLYKDDMDSTNIHRLFQFVCTGLETSLAAAPVRQHVATYWFHVEDLAAGDSIVIDTSTFNSFVNLTFIGAAPQNDQYVPRWGGKAVIRRETADAGGSFDLGSPDSVIMIISPLILNSDYYDIVADLYFVSDAQDISGAAIGFSWDSPSLVMDSAAMTPPAEEAFSFEQSLLYKDNINPTNARRLFQFGGTGLSTSLTAAPGRQHVATYWFHVEDLAAGDSIVIDTSTYSCDVSLKFVDAADATNQYEPVWWGAAIVQWMTDLDMIERGNLPASFTLEQNYPNPFNASTVIGFDVPKRSQVTLAVFNILGQKVATLISSELAPNRYAVTWDGSTVPSGVYLYRLQAGDFVETKKMVLLK